MKWLWLLLLIPAAAAQIGPDSYGYVTIGPAPTLADYVDLTMEPIAVGAADNGGEPITFDDFTFTYYGLEKNGGVVAEDGFFMFGSVLGQTDQPVPIPNPASPNDFVAPLWIDNDADCLIPGDEQNPFITGNVHTTAVADDGHSIFIAGWENMPFIFNGLCRGANDYQVKLFSETDILEFHYEDASNFEDLTRLDECAPTTIGFEEGGGAGTRGLEYGSSTPVIPNSCSNVFSFTNTAMRSWVNDAEDANDQTVVTQVGVPVNFFLNISDDPLTITKTSDPSSGALNNMPDSADGVQYWPDPVTYQPNPGFAGTDGYTYTVRDGFDVPQSATVTIIVDGPATAVNDAYTTEYETALDIASSSLLANDSDANGDTLTITSRTNPSSGTLTDTTDGYTYTPNGGFSGTDSFTYTISDGRSSTDSATVTITVHPPNVAPVAKNDNYGTDKNTALNVAASGVLSNDVDTDALTAELLTSPTGALTFNSDGSFDYTPPFDVVGSDSFTYRAFDGLAYSQAATVTIAIAGVDVAPTAVDDEATMDEDGVIDIAVLANDYDENNDPFSMTSFTANDGIVTKVGNSLRYEPTANWHGTTSFSYTIQDDTGMSATGTVTVTVNSVNDEPIGDNYDVDVNENTVLDVEPAGVLTDATDADEDTLTTILKSSPASGTLLLRDDGSFLYTPATDFIGTVTAQFAITDGIVETAEYTLTINVLDVPNVTPTALDDEFTLDEDTLLHATFVNLLDNDDDPDGTLTLLGFTPATYGLVVDHGDGTWSYAPPHDWYGTDTFTYTVEDNEGATNSASVILHVESVVDPPRVDFDITAAQGMAAGKPITFTSTSTPGDAPLVDWRWTIEGVEFVGTATTYSFDLKATHPVTLMVTDADGETSSATKDVVLTNRAPVAAFKVDSTYPLRLLSLSTDDQPLQLTWTIDGQSYAGSVFEATLDAGSYAITLTATDPHGVQDSVTQQVTVSVPVISPSYATPSGSGGAALAPLGPLRASQPPPLETYPSEPSGQSQTLEVDEEPEEKQESQPIQAYQAQESSPERGTPWLAILSWLGGAALVGGMTAWIVLLILRRKS